MWETLLKLRVTLLKVIFFERHCSKKGFKKGDTCRGGACTDVGNVQTPKECIQMERSRPKEGRQCTNENVRWVEPAMWRGTYIYRWNVVYSDGEVLRRPRKRDAIYCVLIDGIHPPLCILPLHFYTFLL